MTPDRLPDCRPPRRDEGVTSAASHPELLCGYLAMRPRIRIPLTPAEQAMHRKWTRRTITAVVLVIAGVLTLPAFKRETKGGFEARAGQPVPRPARKARCIPHQNAARAIGMPICGTRDCLHRRRPAQSLPARGVSQHRHAPPPTETAWISSCNSS